MIFEEFKIKNKSNLYTFVKQLKAKRSFNNPRGTQRKGVLIGGV